MLYWNKDFQDDTAGLDILGVRSLDQSIEADLVNGITTISARGRYFSVLPWALGAFYKCASGQYDPNQLFSFLTRVELLVVAASKFDDRSNVGGSVLGSDVFSQSVDQLRAGESVELLPSTFSRMLNTYFNPCKTLGLLNTSSSNGLQFLLTPRGKNIFEARQAALKNPSIASTLYEGAPLTRQLVEESIDDFSIGALRPESSEAALLREYFQESFAISSSPNDLSQRRYAKFNDTTKWIASWVSSGTVKANQMLAKNMRACAKGARTDDISKSWARYEWRRRQHYAMELLLSAVCGILDDLGGDGGIKDIIFSAEETHLEIGAHLDMWPDAADLWRMSARDAVQAVPDDLTLDLSLPFNAMTHSSPADRLIAGFGLLAALEVQSRPFRHETSELRENLASNLAVELVQNPDDTTFTDYMARLVEECAINPHWQVTLRKMGNNQKCSLRFFLDGPHLRRTATPSSPGFSGSRLENTLNILIDIGVMRRDNNGQITIAGTA